MVRYYPYAFLTLVAILSGLIVSGCTVTPEPIRPQDDIKPGRGLLTGEKGYFEIRPSTEPDKREASKNTNPHQ